MQDRLGNPKRVITNFCLEFQNVMTLKVFKGAIISDLHCEKQIQITVKKIWKKFKRQKFRNKRTSQYIHHGNAAKAPDQSEVLNLENTEYCNEVLMGYVANSQGGPLL